ncbi:MAG TPA: heme ABC transporter ATP-binding protein [Armatimonadota bacterium]|nr:heme ABC transporter ATP-binding protein [Armatimonadota bacterium]
MTTAESVIHAASLICGYDGREVLHGVDFNVARGEFVGVLGPNGSGKSTLLRAVTGVLRLASGSADLFGTPLREADRRDLARRVGVVPQASVIPFEFTVREIVAMGRAPHIARLHGESDVDRAAIEAALSRTDTAGLSDRLMSELSGGEAQRVTIARALAQEPELLLLDEPTAFLDLNHQIEVFELLRRLNRDDELTVTCVSHDLNLAALYCDRIVLLRDGRVVAEGPPTQVITAERIADVYGATVLVDDATPHGRPRVTLLRSRSGDGAE